MQYETKPIHGSGDRVVLIVVDTHRTTRGHHKVFGDSIEQVRLRNLQLRVGFVNALRANRPRTDPVLASVQW